MKILWTGGAAAALAFAASTLAAQTKTIPGETITLTATDKAKLAMVKVGDKLDITWTEALILSLDQGK